MVVTITRQVVRPLSTALRRLHHQALVGCFPGVVEVRDTAVGRMLIQTLDFPLLGERQQGCHCLIQESHVASPCLEAQGWMDGALLSTALIWQLTPAGGGMTLTCKAQYTVAAAIIDEMTNALRRRSPLPIRTDAEAIFSRAIGNLLEDHLDAYSHAYGDNLCAVLERDRFVP